MNTKKLTNIIDRLKEIDPDIYSDSIKVSFPFYTLSSLLYGLGQDILVKKFDLTQGQLDVLASLCYESDDFTLAPSQLYDRLNFSSGGMTKILNNLEKKQYIQRVKNKHDKRSRLVKITKSGQDIAKKATKTIINLEEEYFSKLNKNEQKQFTDLLNKLLL